ncbi:DotI/IcmL family type IV secretion protein [Legionella nagasakiensis]|uniref:DotI/IcmL family type IV secretion protein n=1 Tax=Legionella nagasakiensis TaxID=535290 RepID=UPI0010549CD4|nr:DotI/IcmL family type IV secretion protein [Legionella nagasakiensis]
MNKTILCSALAAILGFPAYADNTAPNTSTSSMQALQTLPNTEDTATPQASTVINCEYHIPADKTDIDPELIKSWAEKATVQSFDFNSPALDQELEKLKACFTEQGWQGFHTALEQSGNINAIKTQKLSVSSQVDGEIKINPVKENQWKVTVPLQVVYQNDKQKLTQLLSVDVLIGRKVSGDLGIMQMIATPRLPNNQANKPAAADSKQPETSQAKEQTQTENEKPTSPTEQQ